MTQHPWETEETSVHLVMLPERAGLFGAWLDRESAHRHAESIKGVVASVPITADYRESGERGEVSPP